MDQSRINQRGGGVGPFIHTSLNYERVSGISLNNAESLWLKILFGDVDIVVGVVYRKPDSILDDFTDDMNRILHSLHLERNSCIVTGDFNINMLSLDNRKQNFLHMTECYGLRQLINRPTRVTSTTSSLIDHIYTNISSYNIQSGCINVEIADHFPVYAIFEKFKSPASNKKYVTCRNFLHYSVQSFSDELMSEQWLDVYECFDANDAYNAFYKRFMEICDKHAPNEKRRVNSSVKKKSKTWITKAIKRSITKKHNLYDKVIKSNFEQNCLDKYKKYRNILTTVLRKAKQMHHDAQFERDKHNSKKTWNHINELLNKKSTSQNATKIQTLERKDTNGTSTNVTTPFEIANTFNDFFANIGINLASKIVDTNMEYNDYLGHRYEKSFFFLPVTFLEVKDVINTLEPKKACEYDDFSVLLLKDEKDFCM